ncbi:hypothetical protein FRC06_003637 [Ceratobasidium sp. 370]|nr:hypothetical protein FRC06_003637 [Ceratobasidium sp. 370]
MSRIRAAGGRLKIRKQYNVMTGTGTGALIVCMLGLLGMDIEEVISTYTKLVEGVFSDKKVISTSGSGAFKASKLEEELKKIKIVRDSTGNEDTRMMGALPDEDDCKIMVFAMSKHNMNASAPRIFRSYRSLENQMPDCPIWQALCATMAHPELFKSTEIAGASGIGESLVGGDVGCSNPTPHALAEVSALYPDRHIASVVCIGSGHARTIEIPKSNPLHRIMPMNVLIAMKDIATDSERVAQEMATRFERTASVYFRFSVDQRMQDVRMSRWQQRTKVLAHTRAYLQTIEVNKRMSEAVKAISARRNTLKAADIGGQLQQPAVHPSDERSICVAHGLGGTGKTQLALKVIERTLENWTDIVYVDATSRETTLGALTGFAMAKKIGETHEDTIRWLESSPRLWLLVFDNADDPGLGLPDFIPGGSHGRVLITTRLRSLALLAQGLGSECNVGGMDSEEAVELLLKKARMQDKVLPVEEMEAATKLVEDLGYLALAIVHAGAYIWYSKSGIAKYRKQCLEHTQAFLEKCSKLPGTAKEYKNTVYTTWLMSYERLEQRTQQLLGLIAYLHGHGITEDIFKRAASDTKRTPLISPSDSDVATRKYIQDYLGLFIDTDGHWDSNAFSVLVDELLLYSLVDYDRVNETYTIVALKHTSHLLAFSIDGSDDIEAHAFRRGLVLHVIKLLETSMVDASDASLLVEVYKENGRWKEVERLLTQVVDAQKQVGGERHPDTLTSMNDLAEVYGMRGRWNEAEALLLQVLDARKQDHGEHHPDTLTSMKNLLETGTVGRVRSATAAGTRYTEAGARRAPLAKVLDAWRRELGERHPGTLTGMGNLAMVYLTLGRVDEAAALQVQVLAGRKRELGEHHPDTLTIMNNLALTYMRQGRCDEARVLQMQVLDGRRRDFGERHSDTLGSISNLAGTYAERGRWDEAEPLLVQVVDAQRRDLGERHPNTLASMNNLVGTYAAQGKWEESNALLFQVVQIMAESFGEQHPQTWAAARTLAFQVLRQAQAQGHEIEGIEEIMIDMGRAGDESGSSEQMQSTQTFRCSTL